MYAIRSYYAFELGIRNLDGDDRCHPLAEIIAGDRRLDVFEEVVGGGVGIHRSGERRLEADQMGPTLVSVDVVGSYNFV